MSEDRHHLSGEAFEQLNVWVSAVAPDDPKFIPGLIVIIEMEIDRAMRNRPCWKALRALKPCSN